MNFRPFLSCSRRTFHCLILCLETARIQNVHGKISISHTTAWERLAHSWCLRIPVLQENKFSSGQAYWLQHNHYAGKRCWYEPPYDKTNKMTVRPAKTQISLGIRPVWSESSLSAWRKVGSLATHWAHNEDSDQTGRMPRLIWVFAGRTVTLLVLSCFGSYGCAQ